MSEQARPSTPEVGRDSGAPAATDSDGPRCLWGPSRCIDDLCRNSDIGLCGLRDDDFYDDENEDWDDWSDEEVAAGG